jgi:hypothetical protein
MNDLPTKEPEPLSESVRPLSAVNCDFCQASIALGGLYHRLSIAMNEASRGAMPTACTVEEETELVACPVCEPRVSKHVEGLLTELWQLMDEPGEIPGP